MRTLDEIDRELIAKHAEIQLVRQHSSKTEIQDLIDERDALIEERHAVFLAELKAK